MTFRHGLAYRWMFPVLIVPCAALLWWALSLSVQELAGYAGALGLVLALLLAIQSWRVWTTRVTVGDTSIEWNRGTEYGSVGTRDVAALGIRRTLSGVRAGLVERESGIFRPLPLMPRGLYDLLSGRYGKLPPDDERDLFD